MINQLKLGIHKLTRIFSSRQGKILLKIGQLKIFHPLIRFSSIVLAVFVSTIAIHAVSAQTTPNTPHPKVVLISLDGARASFVEDYFANGVLSPTQGLGLLKNVGVVAKQNVTCTPSLTAACHIEIATGSTTSKTDIDANSFELVASPLYDPTTGRDNTISGFSAPIGGYTVHGINGTPSETTMPTAEPLWIRLRQNGKKVVTATFPGGDGVDVTVPGLTNSPIIQSASKRTVDYTVPFGAGAGVFSKAFSLTAADFSTAPASTTAQLLAAGKVSYSPVLQKTTPLDTFTVSSIPYIINAAALDTTNDQVTNYDTLVFFDATQGIKAGPFSLPSTGPAYVKARNKVSSPFYLEGNPLKAGTGFFVSYLDPNLSTVRIARYSVNYIPRNPAVIADVDDINNNVGFWANQPDFSLTERIAAGTATFPDSELETIYQDQVRKFVDYQTRVALRAIGQNPTADLVMVYIEQPDGSEHQFLITDPRQATDPTNPNTILGGQDQAKITRYQKYVQTAYRAANNAVQRIIDTVGTDTQGKPNSNIIVVSDHGFESFHTSVSINNLLTANGIDLTKVRAVTSGPATNVYINLQGRESGGTVSPAEYVTLQQQIAQILQSATDTNPNYTQGSASVPLFEKVYSRPIPSDSNDPSFGIATNQFIAQDSGDILALLTVGYNFDGTQSPIVQRLGDPTSTTPVLSVSNFYGAHGYDGNKQNLSAIFYAAGPDIGQGTLDQISNVDITPTINKILGVANAPTVEGTARL